MPESRRRSRFQKLLAVPLILIGSVLFAVALQTIAPRIWSTEHRFSDFLTALITPSAKEIDPDIVLVTVRDDPSHRARMTSLLPTDRTLLAELTNCLVGAEPAVIGYDMLFDWPDVPGTKTLSNELAASADTTPIIIGIPALSPDERVMQTRREIKAFAAMANADLGIVNLNKTAVGGVVRRMFAHEGQDELPLAWAGAKASGRPLFLADETRAHRLSWVYGPKRKPGEDRRVRFSDYPAVTLLELCEANRVDAVARMVGGKIVLVGSAAQNDNHLTPLSVRSAYRSGLPGIEIHATAIAQILRGPDIHQVTGIWVFVAALFAAAWGLAIDTFGRLKVRKKLSISGSGVALLVASTLLMSVANVLLPITTMLLAMGTGAFASLYVSETKKVWQLIQRRITRN